MGIDRVGAQGGDVREEDELAQRRDRRGRVPLDVAAAAERIDGQRTGEDGASGGGARGEDFTLRVKRHGTGLQRHDP